jgi:putative ABC transport system substrate-binding protein
VRRRDFLALIGGAGAARPLPAAAQQLVPVIGHLHSGSPEPFEPFTAAFRQGLSDTGYVEGQNLAIEYRWAEEHPDRLPAMAADLVARKVDLIAAITETATRVARNASATIPIVFFVGSDPVVQGFVASLARPGGNLTGVTMFGGELTPKRLELLRQLVPRAKIIGVLVNQSNPLAAGLQDAAAATGVTLRVVQAGSDSEIDAAFETFAQLQVDGLIVASGTLFHSRRQKLAALALRHAIPTISYRREFADAGGLIGYGPSFIAVYRELGIDAGKILKGAKPADLPVEQPTKFELVINLKTAKALGLSVPQSLLARADEIIE